MKDIISFYERGKRLRYNIASTLLLFVFMLTCSASVNEVEILLEHAEIELDHPHTYLQGVADLYLILEEGSFAENRRTASKLFSLIRRAHQKSTTYREIVGDSKVTHHLLSAAIERAGNTKQAVELLISASRDLARPAHSTTEPAYNQKVENKNTPAASKKKAALSPTPPRPRSSAPSYTNASLRRRVAQKKVAKKVASQTGASSSSAKKAKSTVTTSTVASSALAAAETSAVQVSKDNKEQQHKQPRNKQKAQQSSKINIEPCAKTSTSEKTRQRKKRAEKGSKKETNVQSPSASPEEVAPVTSTEVVVTSEPQSSQSPSQPPSRPQEITSSSSGTLSSSRLSHRPLSIRVSKKKTK
jgi:hypothetical protein